MLPPAPSLLGLLLLLLLCPAHVGGLWWAVGSPLVMDPTSICRKARRLAGRQAELCQAEPEVVAELARGARLGVRECQFQFRFRRWNCSSHSKAFGRILQQDIRETAFVFAITAAGASHAVTQACSMGELLQCGCQAPRGRAPPRPPGLPGTPGPPGPVGSPDGSAAWEWGGCGDDVDFGDEKSRLFMDARHKRGRGDIRALVQLHNNEAGRLVDPLGLAKPRTPNLPPSARSFAPRRPCGAIRAPSASATGCRARARCEPAGRSCPRSARWARGCSSASTAPRVSWEPMTARLCCPQSALSSRRAAPTSSTPPTRQTSALPTGAPARLARAAAPATAAPRTSAAATCCAAAAGTARRACSSRRTACAASTGAASCSATAVACARSSASASDAPPGDRGTSGPQRGCDPVSPTESPSPGPPQTERRRRGVMRQPRKAQGAGEPHRPPPTPPGSALEGFRGRLCSPSRSLAPIWKPKSQSLGLWMQDSLELLAIGWVGEFSINKSI
ncbi:protein Wnt-6 isoform X1 [Ursus maritimus]|uniref:Protein Wnt n=1 Tax=Ursus maritimus TaxID=29073 RepID=A0A8M1GL79_URSMA|nr:protein Wnt-6 isoform X1 [Ursus maritimus]